MISIIIPNYNSSCYLAEMINCILIQTYKDWELIIVDDQSTDDSIEMISKYIAKDNRIRLIVRDRFPKGAQTCRNIGFLNSKGEYVVFFDADDLISECCLENRVKFMQENPEISYGIFKATSFNVNIKPPDNNNSNNKYGGKIWGKEIDDDLLSLFLQANYPFTVWTNIYRKDKIIAYSWDEKIAVYQDFDFLIKMILDGLKFKFANTNEIDYYYRQHFSNNNTSSSFVSIEKCNSTIYLFSKILNLLKQRTDYKQRKKEFLHFIVLHFERLVMDGDKRKIDDYLRFCNVYYSKFVFYSLCIIAKFAQPIKRFKLRKGILYLLILVRFGFKKYLKALIDQIKFL